MIVFDTDSEVLEYGFLNEDTASHMDVGSIIKEGGTSFEGTLPNFLKVSSKTVSEHSYTVGKKGQRC